ncbi:hypothetical protein KKE14_02980 [Patescibacteria group bacterium]|nr:hypothetical protein [Patescibacteria group bacterium]
MNKIFSNFQSREYSLLRVYAAYEGVQQHFEPLLDCEVGDILMVYRGAGLVHAYYRQGIPQSVYQHVGLKVQNDPILIKQSLARLMELFTIFEPYYQNKKTIKDVKEMEYLYHLYAESWVLVGITFIIPDLPDAPVDLKELTYKVRKETQEYNETMQEVFRIALENWYPHLKGKADFVLPEEVWSGAVKDTTILENLEERSKGFVFYNEQLLVGPDVDLHLKEVDAVLEKEGDDQTSEFSGQIAQSGKVQGTVCLVITREDLDKVTSENVLVTAMTMPAYLPAMKKAVAFVTDEGGITCHAAIIAREMNKPCIIGTRVATKVLKDGDLVEVDADNGKVKILKRS